MRSLPAFPAGRYTEFAMNASVLAQLVVLGAIWGASFLFQRIAVPEVGAGMTAAVRVISAALVLPLVLLVLRKRLPWKERWRDFVYVGFVAAGLPFIFFAFGAYHLPAGYLAVLNSTVPLFTVLLTWIAGTRPSLSKFAGVVVGILGVFTLARFGTVAFTWQAAIAFALVLGAAVCYAIAARAAQQRFPGVDPLAVAAGNMIGASLPLIPVAAWNFPTHWPSAAAIGSLLVLGIVCTAIAYILFYRILAAAGSERTVTVTFLIPVFALIWAALFLHEPITWAAIVGCALVLFAVALIFEKVPGFKPKPALAAAKQA